MFFDIFKNCFYKRKRSNDNLRTIYINGHKPDFYYGPNKYKYPDNSIKTSKYTILNFIIKNLFEQFRRIANFYFLWTIIMRVSLKGLFWK